MHRALAGVPVHIITVETIVGKRFSCTVTIPV